MAEDLERFTNIRTRRLNGQSSAALAEEISALVFAQEAGPASNVAPPPDTSEGANAAQHGWEDVFNGVYPTEAEEEKRGRNLNPAQADAVSNALVRLETNLAIYRSLVAALPGELDAAPEKILSKDGLSPLLDLLEILFKAQDTAILSLGFSRDEPEGGRAFTRENGQDEALYQGMDQLIARTQDIYASALDARAITSAIAARLLDDFSRFERETNALIDTIRGQVAFDETRLEALRQIYSLDSDNMSYVAKTLDHFRSSFLPPSSHLETDGLGVDAGPSLARFVPADAETADAETADAETADAETEQAPDLETALSVLNQIYRPINDPENDGEAGILGQTLNAFHGRGVPEEGSSDDALQAAIDFEAHSLRESLAEIRSALGSRIDAKTGQILEGIEQAIDAFADVDLQDVHKTNFDVLYDHEDNISKKLGALRVTLQKENPNVVDLGEEGEIVPDEDTNDAKPDEAAGDKFGPKPGPSTVETLIEASVADGMIDQDEVEDMAAFLMTEKNEKDLSKVFSRFKYPLDFRRAVKNSLNDLWRVDKAGGILNRASAKLTDASGKMDKKIREYNAELAALTELRKWARTPQSQKIQDDALAVVRKERGGYFTQTVQQAVVELSQEVADVRKILGLNKRVHLFSTPPLNKKARPGLRQHFDALSASIQTLGECSKPSDFTNKAREIAQSLSQCASMAFTDPSHSAMRTTLQDAVRELSKAVLMDTASIRSQRRSEHAARKLIRA